MRKTVALSVPFAALAVLLASACGGGSSAERISFISDRSGPNLDVYVMNADGSGQTALMTDRGTAAAWSPDGRIAFVSDREGNFEIYTANADGSGQTRLTDDPADDLFGIPFFFSTPWSPDGSRMIFHRGSFSDFVEFGGNADFEIYAMNADGSAQTNLTNNPALDCCPAWSPDGSRIAFASNRDGDLEIYVMNADGSGQTRLTTDSGRTPVWSPDGERIAFTSARDGDGEIYVMNADGSDQTRLTASRGPDADPDWSPDGTRIAFVSNRDDPQFDIYVMNADGSAQTNLTNSPALDSEPSWSPDGSRIVFRSERDGNLEIYVMNSDGSDQTNLTNSPTLDTFPVWSPAP